MRLGQGSRVALALALGSAAPRTALAQAGVGGGVGGGVTFPIGSFHTAYANGYNALAAIDLHAPGVPFGFRIDGMYDRLQGNESVFGSSPPHAAIWTVNANIVANLENEPGASFVPYVIFGAGYYNLDFPNFAAARGNSTAPTPAAGTTHTAHPGANGGIGVRFETGGLRIFVDGRYHYILGREHLRMIPFTLGVTFGG